MERSAIAETWERRALKGERSVANNDEDSVTMGVEAVLNCLPVHRRREIDGLYFATTTPVYREKMNAALIASASDLDRTICACDFGHSLRSGTAALKAAFDAVESGRLHHVLVAAADCRLAYPRSDQEQLFGDGAAAVGVSREGGCAELQGSVSLSSEMMDVWRNPEDRFVKTWESRFILGEGYVRHMAEAVETLLQQSGLQPGDIAKAILPAPDVRTQQRLARKIGFDTETQLQDPLIANIGNCGAAQPLLMLAAAFEEGRPGDRLLLAAYADGADAMLFQLTGEVRKPAAGPQMRISDLLARKLPLSSYARFLSFKGVLEALPGEPFRLFPSATVTWRDRASIMRGYGSRCRKCGETVFPVQRVCYQCGAADDFEEVRVADLEGSVFTFTLDQLAGRSDDPLVIQTIAELGEEKVRFYGMLTDCAARRVEIGMPVRLTFRRIYEGAGMHNYFWKCRPVERGRPE
jgi:3-hydroxy-3-methylglutaryl CoA synthase